jgi:ketosteroid isomerase-like protein
MENNLATRVAQLEDRAAISETVTRYAMGVDRRDWAMFGSVFDDVVWADFSAGGVPAQEFSREALVDMTRSVLDGFAATQHISPNHVIEFDPEDPDAAVCHSYMFAQHLLATSPNGTYYLLRGSYTNVMRRTQHGWRIARIVQHRSWEDGNLGAVAEAAEVVTAARSN